MEDAVHDYQRAFPDTPPGESGPGAANTTLGIADALTLPVGEGADGCPPPGEAAAVRTSQDGEPDLGG